MKTNRRHSYARVKLAGLSLMETLLVLAMLSVVLSWAVPQYQNHLRRGQRQLAKLALMKSAQGLEQAATTQGSYPANLPASVWQTPELKYRISNNR
jgi:type IV pilus assembly protein PilE